MLSKVQKFPEGAAEMEPVISDLLEWTNKQLNADLKNLSDLISGAPWCQLIHMIDPTSFNISAVHFQPQSRFDIYDNYVILRWSVARTGEHVPLHLRELLQGGREHILKLALWLRKFHGIYFANQPYDALAMRQGQRFLLSPSALSVPLTKKMQRKELETFSQRDIPSSLLSKLQTPSNATCSAASSHGWQIYRDCRSDKTKDSIGSTPSLFSTVYIHTSGSSERSNKSSDRDREKWLKQMRHDLTEQSSSGATKLANDAAKQSTIRLADFSNDVAEQSKSDALHSLVASSSSGATADRSLASSAVSGSSASSGSSVSSTSSDSLSSSCSNEGKPKKSNSRTLLASDTDFPPEQASSCATVLPRILFASQLSLSSLSSRASSTDSSSHSDDDSDSCHSSSSSSSSSDSFCGSMQYKYKTYLAMDSLAKCFASTGQSSDISVCHIKDNIKHWLLDERATSENDQIVNSSLSDRSEMDESLDFFYNMINVYAAGRSVLIKRIRDEASKRARESEIQAELEKRIMEEDPFPHLCKQKAGSQQLLELLKGGEDCCFDLSAAPMLSPGESWLDNYHQPDMQALDSESLEKLQKEQSKQDRKQADGLAEEDRHRKRKQRKQEYKLKRQQERQQTSSQKQSDNKVKCVKLQQEEHSNQREEQQQQQQQNTGLKKMEKGAKLQEQLHQKKKLKQRKEQQQNDAGKQDEAEKEQEQVALQQHEMKDQQVQQLHQMQERIRQGHEELRLKPKLTAKQRKEQEKAMIQQLKQQLLLRQAMKDCALARPPPQSGKPQKRQGLQMPPELQQKQKNHQSQGELQPTESSKYLKHEQKVQQLKGQLHQCQEQNQQAPQAAPQLESPASQMPLQPLQHYQRSQSANIDYLSQTPLQLPSALQMQLSMRLQLQQPTLLPAELPKSSQPPARCSCQEAPQLQPQLQHLHSFSMQPVSYQQQMQRRQQLELDKFAGPSTSRQSRATEQQLHLQSEQVRRQEYEAKLEQLKLKQQRECLEQQQPQQHKHGNTLDSTSAEQSLRSHLLSMNLEYTGSEEEL